MARFPSSSSAKRGGSFRTAGSHWESTWSERLSPSRRDRFQRQGCTLAPRPHSQHAAVLDRFKGPTHLDVMSAANVVEIVFKNRNWNTPALARSPRERAR